MTVIIVTLLSLNYSSKILSRQAIANNSSKIVVNQIDYLPQWQKTAFLLNNQKLINHPQLIDRHTPGDRRSDHRDLPSSLSCKRWCNGKIDQLDYLLGRNYFNQTFITGIGTKYKFNF